jgi:hypothetical protein
MVNANPLPAQDGGQFRSRDGRRTPMKGRDYLLGQGLPQIYR